MYASLCSQGGIKSVVWTDAFQTVVVFLGMATVLGKVCFYSSFISCLFLHSDNDGAWILNKTH
jgi:Na+/proline symporter